MSDLQTTTLLVGLAVALARAIEWLAKASMKRNGNGTRSAGLTANEWKTEINEQVKKALKDTEAARHQELRKLMTDVIRQELKGRR